MAIYISYGLNFCTLLLLISLNCTPPTGNATASSSTTTNAAISTTAQPFTTTISSVSTASNSTSTIVNTTTTLNSNPTTSQTTLQVTTTSTTTSTTMMTTSTLTPTTTVNPTGIIKNGDFNSNLAFWTIEVTGVADATMTVTANILDIVFTQTGAGPDVTLRQDGISIVNDDGSYAISFDAYITGDPDNQKIIGCYIFGNGNTGARLIDTPVMLTNTNQTFNIEWGGTAGVYSEFGIGFWLGGDVNGSTITIDNISMLPLGGGSSAPGDILPPGLPEEPIDPSTDPVLNAYTIPVHANGELFFKLINDTDSSWASTQIYWAIIGLNAADELSHLDKDGNLIKCDLSDNGGLQKDLVDYVDYWYSHDEAPGVHVPKMHGARLFLSYGSPMYIRLAAAAVPGGVGYVGPDIANPSDPNYDVYFDFIEFTIDDYGFHGNNTRVDQFGFPMTMELKLSGGSSVMVGETESRSSLFDAFENDVPIEFQGCVRRPYRIIAPGKGDFKAGGPQETYFNSYVDALWTYYSQPGNYLVFNHDFGTFSGHVTGSVFDFTLNSAGSYVIAAKPSTIEILEGSGVLATGGTEELAMQARLCAAFNRHIVDQPNLWHDGNAFYQTGSANYYSDFWHSHSINGRAYGFAYDDVYNQATLIEEVDPTDLIIALKWD